VRLTNCLLITEESISCKKSCRPPVYKSDEWNPCLGWNISAKETKFVVTNVMSCCLMEGFFRNVGTHLPHYTA
jgi:hypothetical protein